MPDVQEVFRMATQKVLPDPGALERQNRNQRHHSTRRKAGAYAVVAAIVVGGIVAAIAAIRSNGKGTPAHRPSPTPSAAALSGLTPQKVAVVGLDGTIRGEVPGLPADAYGLALSPDGHEVAFVTTEGYTNRIGTIGIDGQGMQILTSGSLAATTPSWSPDGSHIAFVGMNEKLNQDIYVMDADGANVRRLTTSSAIDEWPSWSPDGSRILYDNTGRVPPDQNGYSPTAEIFTVPARGGTPTRLTNNALADAAAAYSPDGKQIVLFHDGGIWLMDANGRNARPLYRGGSFTPRWSPDGTKIAFTTYDASWSATVQRFGVVQHSFAVVRVHVVDVRTGQVSDVGHAEMATDLNTPQWLPSGDALLLNLASQT